MLSIEIRADEYVKRKSKRVRLPLKEQALSSVPMLCKMAYVKGRVIILHTSTVFRVLFFKQSCLRHVVAEDEEQSSLVTIN